MKIIICTICIIFNITAISAQSKFGYVNISDIMQSMPEYSKAQADVNALQDQYEKDIQLMQEELKKKYLEFESSNANTTDIIKKKQEQELVELNNRIQQTYQDSQQALQKSATEKMQAISKKILDVLEIIGKESEYVYIMDINDNTKFINTNLSTDLTNQVKSKLGLK